MLLFSFVFNICFGTASDRPNLQDFSAILKKIECDNGKSEILKELFRNYKPATKEKIINSSQQNNILGKRSNENFTIANMEN